MEAPDVFQNKKHMASVNSKTSDMWKLSEDLGGFEAND